MGHYASEMESPEPRDYGIKNEKKPSTSEGPEKQVRWARVNDEPFEYAIQKGPYGDAFVMLLNGTCLRRPCNALKLVDELIEALEPFANSPYASDMVKVPGFDPTELSICEGVSLADMRNARRVLTMAKNYDKVR